MTGHRELSLLSTADEIALGVSGYGPIQQLKGGLYQVDDRVAKYVSAVGNRIAQFSDRSLPYEFVVVNDSTPNAWALPGGKIGIHRGLLVELENGAELAAVLGHEIVHASAKHAANEINRDVLLALAGLGIQYAVDDSEHARKILFATDLSLGLVGQKFNRDDERMADYHGIKYMHLAGYDTAAAVSLQEKFVAMAADRRSDWVSGLFASHPPSDERVENNRDALSQYPSGGDLGEASFRVHMRTLFADRGAYKLADQARNAANTDTSRALRLIERAIDLQPRESLFYGIRGEIFALQGRHQIAVTSYGVAIDLNSDYFAHYLGRGMAFDALGDMSRAQDDLRRSNRLLPTSFANYKLGIYELASGNREEAKSQFELASAGKGEFAKLARAAYVRLDAE